MDFTAYDGEGSGSLYARDLTLGETNYTAVANLQNINLKIRSRLGTSAPPSSWNALFIGSDSGVPLDNPVVDPAARPAHAIRCCPSVVPKLNCAGSGSPMLPTSLSIEQP